MKKIYWKGDPHMGSEARIPANGPIYKKGKTITVKDDMAEHLVKNHNFAYVSETAIKTKKKRRYSKK